MQPIERIQHLEKRAALVNVSLHTLCQRAGVAHYSFSRWLRGVVSPTHRVFERDMAAMTEALERIEAEVFANLAPKFRGPEQTADKDHARKAARRPAA